MDDGVNGAFTTHRQKRHADDNLESEQRLAKRFNLLSLEHIGKLYTPVKPPTPERRKRSNAFSDSMRLDDTRDKVYIHDLDEEVSDIESEEEKLLFLPDIEQRLTKIPKSVLISQSQPPISNEIVLYNIPESLSIPKEQDSVRKAILETRARAREKQAPETEAPRSQQHKIKDSAMALLTGDLHVKFISNCVRYAPRAPPYNRIQSIHQQGYYRMKVSSLPAQAERLDRAVGGGVSRNLFSCLTFDDDGCGGGPGGGTS
ncbi:MAG: hypothetical protein Q9187_002278 [Circinaria calcarea]